MPVLTVTLNPAVDKLYTVPGFALDSVQRPTETRVYAGGKGINVARVYQTLGEDAAATGFLGGVNGIKIRLGIREENIRSEFILIKQESRLSTVILDPIGRTETVLNENGPQVTSAECDALLQRLRELLPRYDAVILSGSLPPGTPPDIYASIIRLAQDEFGVKAVLDSSGEALALGIAAHPFLVKPNTDELKALSVGGDGWGGSAQALREKYGVTVALITDGARGAVLASAEGVWEAVPPTVEVVSALGSGDSLLAGFVWAWEQGWSHAEALRLGVAAGAANATVYGSGFCTRDAIFETAAQTTLNQID